MRTGLSICLLAVIAAGCVPSLHSIVTEKTLTYDPALAGRYRADDAVWTIDGDPNTKSYSIVIQEKEDKQSLLTAQLVEVKGQRFFDFYPSDDAELGAGDWLKVHLLPVHMFWKVDKTDDGYTLSGLVPDKVKKLLEDKPNMVKHETTSNDEDRVVLTDTPENLHAFLLVCLDAEGLFDDMVELKPAKE